MASLRDARAGALVRRHRDLADDFTRTLPLLLDELDAIDRERNLSELPRTGAEAAEWARPAPAGDPAPTDEQVAAWLQRNPQVIEAWARKQQRVHGTAAPAKPARARGPRGGTAT